MRVRVSQPEQLVLSHGPYKLCIQVISATARFARTKQELLDQGGFTLGSGAGLVELSWSGSLWAAAVDPSTPADIYYEVTRG